MSEEERKRRLSYRHVRKQYIKLLTLFVIIALALTLAFTVLAISLNKTHYVNYKERSNVDYGVHLKPNDFYDESFLGKDYAYIATLIDRVEASFNYGMDVESKSDVKFVYSYSIDSVIQIRDTRSGKLLYSYTESETPTRTQSVTGTGVNVKQTVFVDYTRYNGIAERFISVYKLRDVTSNLIVQMNVKVIGASDEFHNDTNTNSYVSSISIPLTSDTVNVNITSMIPADSEKILSYTTESIADIFRTAALVFLAITLLLVLALTIYVYASRNVDITYEIRVKRLLSAYKSFIQRLQNEFNTSGYQLLMLSAFTEMLEIRDTIQSPILMYENSDKTCTRFLIPTNTKILYVYELKVADYDEIYGTAPEDNTDEPNNNNGGEFLAEEPIEYQAEANEPAIMIFDAPAQTEKTLIEETPVSETEPVIKETVVEEPAAEETAVSEPRVSETEPVIEEIAVPEIEPAVEIEVPEIEPAEKIEVPEIEPVGEIEVPEIESAEEIEVPEIEPIEEAAPEEEPAVEESAPEAEAVIEQAAPEEEPVIEDTAAETAPVSEKNVSEDAPAEAAEPDSIKELLEHIVEIDSDDEDGDSAIACIGEDGNLIKIICTRSFTSNLIQSNPQVKGYYNELKNHILSYKGVKGRVSWRLETYKKGRIQLFKMKIRGKTVCLYCALNPEEYDRSKFFWEKSDAKVFAAVPMMVRIKSDRGLKRAIGLIDDVMKKFEIPSVENAPVIDYVKDYPYETTKVLVEKGLIKILLPGGEAAEPQPHHHVHKKVIEIVHEDTETVEEMVILDSTEIKSEEITEIIEAPTPELAAIDYDDASEPVDEGFVETAEHPGMDVIGVVWPERPKRNKIYRYDPDGERVNVGDIVIVPTYDASKKRHVVRKAAVAHANHKIDPETLMFPVKKIIGVFHTKHIDSNENKEEALTAKES